MSSDTNADEIEQVIESKFEQWESFNDSLASGPEVLGLYEKEVYERICEEGLGYFVETPNGKRPFLVPVEALPDLNQDYFQNPENLDTDKRVFQMFLPSEMDDNFVEQAFGILDEIQSEGAYLLTQFNDGDQDYEDAVRDLFDRLDGVESVPMIDGKNETECSVFHFFAETKFFTEPNEADARFPGMHGQDIFRAKVEQGEVEPVPKDGTVVMLPEHLTDEIIESAWQAYDTQMDILIENHPRYQRLDRDHLIEMLRAEDSVNIFHFEDGHPIFFYIGLTDIPKHASWLDNDIIQEKYATDDTDVLYCPAMFVDFTRQGEGHSEKAFKTLLELVADRGRKYGMYFECTNISATYVPKMGIRAINQSGLAEPVLHTASNVVQKMYKIGSAS